MKSIYFQEILKGIEKEINYKKKYFIIQIFLMDLILEEKN